jgi:uncharacterized glyoxalase superfamily metalloenzyme YdcJ
MPALGPRAHTSLNSETLLSPTALRTTFSQAMSQIYRNEVPLYSTLLSYIHDVNTETLRHSPTLHSRLSATNDLSRLHLERHGAIRLGTPNELHHMSRFLRVLGMEAVGYYDLTPAGLPVHATCFRATSLDELAQNPFRLFTSLLRPDLLSASVRDHTLQILRRRHLFSQTLLNLISRAELQGGLASDDASLLISEGLKIFTWSSHATVSLRDYEALHAESPLLADIAAFPGAHINHLTPRTLDIEAVQQKLRQGGLPMKDAIEGPPRRVNPILLRQTSFRAVEEKVFFRDSIEDSVEEEGQSVLGSHKARFGEIEERGAALTPTGRKMYDDAIQRARQMAVDANDATGYLEAFSQFPDDLESMRKQKLAWFKYFTVEGKQAQPGQEVSFSNFDELVSTGLVGYEPIVYEDFLPLSAAGIFQSNLEQGMDVDIEKMSPAAVNVQNEGKEAFERALQGSVLDEMELYREMEEMSIRECLRQLRTC